MSLNKFSPSEGSSKARRRVGRGIGSGLGKTAGRGGKGQGARRQIHPNFEGGQSPLQRRLPVKKGFRNVNHKEYAIVNLDDLQELFEAGATVDVAALQGVGIINRPKDGVKILGFGSLDKKLTVHAHKFSESAKAAIVAAGGETVTIVKVTVVAETTEAVEA